MTWPKVTWAIKPLLSLPSAIQEKKKPVLTTDLYHSVPLLSPYSLRPQLFAFLDVPPLKIFNLIDRVYHCLLHVPCSLSFLWVTSVASLETWDSSQTMNTSSIPLPLMSYGILSKSHRQFLLCVTHLCNEVLVTITWISIHEVSRITLTSWPNLSAILTATGYYLLYCVHDLFLLWNVFLWRKDLCLFFIFQWPVPGKLAGTSWVSSRFLCNGWKIDLWKIIRFIFWNLLG